MSYLEVIIFGHSLLINVELNQCLIILFFNRIQKLSSKRIILLLFPMCNSKSCHYNFRWNHCFNDIHQWESVLLVKLCGVEQLVHNTPGNSSDHLPFASFNRFLILVMIVLFVDSTCPMAYEWRGVKYCNYIFHYMQKFCMTLLMSWDPLSAINVWRRPYWQVIYFLINLIMSLSLIIA